MENRRRRRETREAAARVLECEEMVKSLKLKFLQGHDAQGTMYKTQIFAQMRAPVAPCAPTKRRANFISRSRRLGRQQDSSSISLQFRVPRVPSVAPCAPSQTESNSSINWAPCASYVAPHAPLKQRAPEGAQCGAPCAKVTEWAKYCDNHMQQ